MDGLVHSIESFGTLDGPGIRFVIFLQGCPMRCKYCHNPDTRALGRGAPRSAQSLIAEFQRNRGFYEKGGITVTGGEALMQIDFLLELFALAKQEGIHTCVDTSGITFRPDKPRAMEKMNALMAMTDLVLLDIKHMDPERHKELTGHESTNIIAFARYLDEKKIPVWIRQVLVPGLTDDEAQLPALGTFLATLTNVQSIEVLPYHTMGIAKYREMNIPYPLEGVPPATREQAERARKIILDAYQKEISH